MTQSARIDLLDLAALGNGAEPNLVALGIDVGSCGRGEQQILRIGPGGVLKRKQMPDQQLAQAVREIVRLEVLVFGVFWTIRWVFFSGL